MRYEVKPLKSDAGYAIWCPTLPGCASQGETEAEAIENIRDAIREYLAVRDEIVDGAESRVVDVA
ncbi:MAG: type II toxin-antitoxin system HicB family antitoxin [Tepidisphaeraceae bacterium]